MSTHRQVAMMACVESHTTPRIRVKDDFSAVLVTGLGKGDSVVMIDDATSIVYDLSGGTSPFPNTVPPLTAVRFCKRAGPSPLATSVEIHRGN